MENENSYWYVNYNEEEDMIHLSEDSIIVDEFIDKNLQPSLFELSQNVSN